MQCAMRSNGNCTAIQSNLDKATMEQPGLMMAGAQKEETLGLKNDHHPKKQSLSQQGVLAAR
jgi:hypothetical protein